MSVKDWFNKDTVSQQATENVGDSLKTLTGGVSFTELSSVVTDYGKSSQNSAIMASVNLPYWDVNENQKKMSGFIKGYMTSGFGWSIQNNYEDLLPVTGFQSTASKFLTGGGSVLGAFGVKMPTIGNFDLSQAQGMSVMSLQQTISIWTSMQKPTFNISILFFDGKGEDTTSVTTAAYIIERALYPKVEGLGSTGTFNLLMSAPGGYLPSIRNENNAGNPNKVFGLTAEGLARLHIGTFASFPEIICTGASFQFSDRMLNNGKPQWLNVTFNFTMWRQPTMSDLAYRYL